MRLFLAPNGFTGTQVEQAAQCFRRLEACGHACAVSHGDSFCLFGDEGGAAFGPGECDVIVSLGGDGSMLRAAQLAMQWDRPLLGINSGRLGWLCAMDFGEIDRFDAILAGCRQSQKRLLTFEYGGETYRALNDIVVGKRNFGGTVDLDVAVGDGRPARLRGDGLIIATPTGSTAYNLSAGGPILDADLSAFLMTPICPHGGFNHPMAVDDSKTVRVAVRNESVGLYADGRYVGELDSTVTVGRAKETLTVYTRGSRNPLDMMAGMERDA